MNRWRAVPAMAGAIVLAVVGVAASSASAQSLPALGVCQRPEELRGGAPVDVELTTVTDTEMVLTWLTCGPDAQPATADSTVRYGLLADPAGWRTVTGRIGAYHLIRISGLRPGTGYGYMVSSNGIPALPDRLSPGTFTTLLPPPGRELFRVAVIADTHLGETVSGLATSSPVELPPGYRSDVPYSEALLAAAVRGANRDGVGFTLAPADVSSHGERAQLRDARRLFAGIRGPTLVARGAHDRGNQYVGSRTECPPDGDCFRATFRRGEAAEAEPNHRPAAKTFHGWRFIALDDANPVSGQGEIPPDQLAWLRDQLERAKAKGQPAVVTMHHPVAEYSSTLAVPPATFGVNQADAEAFFGLIAGYDVRLVISAHTHRNWIAYDPRTGRVPAIEVGPAKEYPAGYSILRFYSGGVIREWFPIDCGFCNAWRATTRGEYLSLYPLYTAGSLRDRNFVHTWDGPDVPGVPSLPLGIWPLTCIA